MNTYKRSRKNGYAAMEAKLIADTEDRFEQLEQDDLVRIIATPEYENYFSVYGEPEAYQDRNGRRVSAEQARKELVEMIDRDGCWYVSSQYRCVECGKWETADGIGMCCGYSNPCDPVENPYVVDLMQSAINEVNKLETRK